MNPTEKVHEITTALNQHEHHEAFGQMRWREQQLHVAEHLDRTKITDQSAWGKNTRWLRAVHARCHTVEDTVERIRNKGWRVSVERVEP